ncbi:MAG: hypothetical protein M3Q07_05030 [Pseudobdellovibrionaceae bacterium]|nr:hypothetical protein [Pseudobdellovibrionaceae bacterium]
MSNVAFAKSLGIRPVAEPDLPSPSLLKSLDYGNIARMAAIAGLSFLAYRSLKALLLSEMAAVALEKIKGHLSQRQQS